MRVRGERNKAGKRVIIDDLDRRGGSTVSVDISKQTNSKEAASIVNSYEAGEDLTGYEGYVGAVVPGNPAKLYIADPLSSNNKLGSGIIISGASTGEQVQICEYGRCELPDTITIVSTQFIYLRDNTPNHSGSAIATATGADDGNQIIAHVLDHDPPLLFVNVQPHYKL